MNKGGLFIILAFIILLSPAGFFVVGKINAASSTILISEIMTSQTSASKNEFIELFNASNNDIDLTGYTLKKKTKSGSESALVSSAKFSGIIPSRGYFLISHPDYKTINADLAYSSTSYSIADNNTVLLYNKEGNLIDKVGYGETTDFETSAATLPEADKSIERKVNNNEMQDTDNNNNDFKISDSPSPQNTSSAKLLSSNSQETTGTIDTTTESSPTSGSSISNVIYRMGDVVINEFVSDPGDEDTEWIELFNNSYKEIDLSGWIIEDGSGAKTNLSGIVSVDNRFKVIENPAGKLNNSGDIIILKDGTGKLIDQVAYGSWSGSTDNVPVASDPYSMARKFDGQNSFNNANDFALTKRLTKGASNIIEDDDENLAENQKYNYSEEIFISEIFPNPAGPDTEKEFIELWNKSNFDVNLSGWALASGDGKKVLIDNCATSTIVSANSYLAVSRQKSRIALNNSQGEVKLYQPLKEKPLQSVKYKNVKEDWSYNLLPDCTLSIGLCGWEWSENKTPGSKNDIKVINHSPQASFEMPKQLITGIPAIFDGSDSSDEDGDKLTFNWDFGDGMANTLESPEHIYAKSGNYKVKLSVSDGINKSEKEKTVTVIDPGETKNNQIKLEPVSGSLILNELLPDPEGSDTEGEWVEIKNISADEVNLLDWQLDNGSQKYTFKDGLLGSKAFYLLKRNNGCITLKNQNGFIKLLNNSGEAVDQVKYEKAVMGESYARGENGQWFWTTRLTPGEENIIQVSKSKAGSANIGKIKVSTSQIIETDLEKIRDLTIGDNVRVKGTVAVVPGVLGTQIFYIVGSPGIQVYNYKKDFPNLKVGDYIEVSGVLAESSGELRLKTKIKDDIKVLNHLNAPMALALSCDKLDEESVGRLVFLTGEITGRKGSTIYLDDGNDEVIVYIKNTTGIKASSFKIGDKVSITGIASKSTSGVRLLPRTIDDIKTLGNAQNDSGLPRVLGEIESDSEWKLAARDKKTEFLKYLLIITVSIIVALIVILIRKIRHK